MVIKQIIELARQQGRTILSEIESKNILSDAGINVTETELAASEQEAVSLAEKMGYPIVLKIASSVITHKSDVNGVKVNLSNKKELIEAYREIMSTVRQKCPAADIQGVSIQKIARPGVEVIIGMTSDAQFGPVIMFGLGGVWVEMLKNVAFGIAPLTRYDARTMISNIRGKALLNGYRGSEPANTTILEEMLLSISDFVERNPQIVELEMNPIIAYQDDAIALDARIVIKQ